MFMLYLSTLALTVASTLAILFTALLLVVLHHVTRICLTFHESLRSVANLSPVQGTFSWRLTLIRLSSGSWRSSQEIQSSSESTPPQDTPPSTPSPNGKCSETQSSTPTTNGTTSEKSSQPKATESVPLKNRI